MKHKIPDYVFLIFSMLSFSVLSFLAGILTLHYEAPLSQYIITSVQSGEEWLSDMRTKQISSPVSHEQAAPKPEITWKPEGALNGYTLLTLRYANTAYLVNMEGAIVHQWFMPFSKAWPGRKLRPPQERAYFEKAHVYPNGDLLVTFTAFDEVPYGKGMVKMDKNSNVLWTYDGTTHHDFYVDQENNTIYALTQKQITHSVDGLESLPRPLLADSIQIISADGKPLKTVDILTAFANSSYKALLYTYLSDHVPWDYMHTNSIMKLEPALASSFPMFKAGQVLISIRNRNIIAVIDTETNAVVWAATGPWRSQHSASFLPNGNILLFDNRGNSVGRNTTSRILTFNPQTLAVANAYPEEHVKPFFSRSYGRVKKLKNENLLITNSLNSEILEITTDGMLVWKYQLPKRYIKIDPGMPPYSKNKAKDLWKNIFSREYVEVDPNLASVIVSADRYEENDLPFLRQ